MSALERLLFPMPNLRPKPLAIIRWWEQRRLSYNLVVGAAGIVSLGVIELIAALPPHGHLMGMPWQLPVIYAVLANLFYSSGWGLELLAYGLWKRDMPRLGPPLFRQGLIFSVGLTLLPIALAGFEWTVRLLRVFFG